jgi:uncharacterized protein with von Willebrand factor type A (vWA) domain
VLTEFFFKLKQGGLPVTIKEFLTLLEALRSHLIGGSLDEFYYLARVCLVKDETRFDRYDRIFAAYFKGISNLPDDLLTQIPEEWLRRHAELLLSDEEKAIIQALGGWEKLMETLRKRLEEQRGRHQGGSKWIGTAGTSPFGAHGYNQQVVRPHATAAPSKSGTSASTAIWMTRWSWERATSSWR